MFQRGAAMIVGVGALAISGLLAGVPAAGAATEDCHKDLYRALVHVDRAVEHSVNEDAAFALAENASTTGYLLAAHTSCSLLDVVLVGLIEEASAKNAQAALLNALGDFAGAATAETNAGFAIFRAHGHNGARRRVGTTLSTKLLRALAGREAVVRRRGPRLIVRTTHGPGTSASAQSFRRSTRATDNRGRGA